MMLRAVVGKGCAHCEIGHPIEKIQLGRGKSKLVIELCLECVMLWFPDKTVDWWEARHAPFKDHVGDALKRAREKERKENEAAMLAAGFAA